VALQDTKLFETILGISGAIPAVFTDILHFRARVLVTEAAGAAIWHRTSSRTGSARLLVRGAVPGFSGLRLQAHEPAGPGAGKCERSVIQGAASTRYWRGTGQVNSPPR